MAWSTLAVVAVSSVGMVYVYYGVMKLPKGVWRLFALLPLIAFYIYMPLKLATVFERGFVSFLFTWLTTFKLLLLCWDAGPAADPWAFSTFPRFLAVISLSLQLKTKSASQARAAGGSGAHQGVKKIQDHNHQPSVLQDVGVKTASIQRKRIRSSGEVQENKSSKTLKNPEATPPPLHLTGKGALGGRNLIQFLDESQLWHIVLLRLFLKFLFLALLSSIYTFRIQLPWWLIYMMYSFHIYVLCSLVFDGLATIVSAATGIELEPAYNKPFLSSSLTDFWGKRWNLLISNLMRTAVYKPVLYVCLRAAQDTNSGKFPASRVEAKVLNESYKPSNALVTKQFEFPGLLHSTDLDSQRFSQLPLWPRTLALISCFVVSGLMHELLFVYISLSWPTGEVTAFFTLHGILAALEVFIRRRFRLKVTKLVSIPITLCFLFFSSIWLFYPPLFRAGTEEQAMVEFQHFFCRLLPENGCS
jgi:hypothetical protein